MTLEHDSIIELYKKSVMTAVMGIIVVSTIIGILTIYPFYLNMIQESKKEFDRFSTGLEKQVQGYLSEVMNVALQVTSRTQARYVLVNYNNNKIDFNTAHKSITNFLSDVPTHSPIVLGISRFAKNGDLLSSVGMKLPKKFYDTLSQSNAIHYAKYYEKNQEIWIVDAPIKDRDNNWVGNDVILFKTLKLQDIITKNAKLFSKSTINFGYIDKEKKHPLFSAGDEHLYKEESNLIRNNFTFSGTNIYLEAAITKSELYNLANTEVIRIIILFFSIMLIGSLGIILLGQRLQKKIVTEVYQRKLNEDKFKNLLDLASDGIHILDLNGNVVECSQSFAKMLGYSYEEALQLNANQWDANIHEDKLVNGIQYLIKHPRKFNTKHLTKNGSILDIQINAKGIELNGQTYLYASSRDITEELRFEQQLEFSSKHDPLTKLPNRFLFNELVQNIMYRSRRNNKQMAILLIDLDSFKDINDTYGRETGDKVLLEMSERILSVIRDEDILARIGGDEFVLCVSELKSNDEIILLLHRLLDTINLPMKHKVNNLSVELSLSASIGITFYPQIMDLGSESLIRQADQAMFRAKNGGKNQYSFFDIDENKSLQNHLENINEISNALANDEFELYYQPKVNMSENRVIGFEALIRWNHPSKGLLYPDSFLPYLHNEENLMKSITSWVLESVYKQIEKWNNEKRIYTVGVNISAYDFKDETFIDKLKMLDSKYENVQPEQIELELLETNALEDINIVNKMIKTCQEIGYKVALDDFGTGFSSLSYLKNLNVDTLKIDKSFVLDMLHDASSFTILEAAIGLANAFKSDIVAEGVEKIEHGVMLLQLGCNVAQGYVIAKPMPLREIDNWIAGFKGFEEWSKVKLLERQKHDIMLASVEHNQWIMMLKNYIDDPDNNYIPELNPQKCRFGMWLNSQSNEQIKNLPEFKQIVEEHNKLHELVKSILIEMDDDIKQSIYEEIESMHLLNSKNLQYIMNLKI
jgi:diguanylate cyclase (GGDEF)-like protein/PAS domain S-box-containing protein